MKKPTHKSVKFTPEEMAYDGPTPKELEHWIPVGRGPEAIFARPPGHGRTVELEPDIAAVFKDSEAVNRALRKLIEAVPDVAKRKKSA
jgi:hypothetical protein